MIPDYQTSMLPVLEQASDKEISTRDVIERLADKYKLSEEDREKMLPSGKQRTFDNRVNWAKGYLRQAGLVRYTKHGYYIATDEGRKVLAAKPERIDNNLLNRYDAFQVFKGRKGTQSGKAEDQTASTSDDDATPDEILRAAHSSPLKKAPLTGFHPTAKHNAAKAVSPSSETMRTI